MYANLRTVDGESNHVIVRRTLPLTDGQADVVRIVETNVSGLQRYRMTDYGLTWRQLRSYMSDHPSRSITSGRDRKSVVSGTSVSVRVDLGGDRIIKKKRGKQVKSARKNTG